VQPLLLWKSSNYHPFRECVFVALRIEHAMRMLHIILSSLTRLSVQYFFTSSHKRHDFRKKLLNIKYMF